MPLQFRRGTNTERAGITPAAGEPVFTTDTKKIFIGDGSTAGGVRVVDTDSAVVTSVIDSAYIQSRDTPQNFAYSALTGKPNLVDSAGVNTLFDTRLGTKSTTNLTEGTNKYFTNARADSAARSAIVLVDAGGAGSMTYDSASGTITYNGPTNSEFLASLTAGEGIDISTGIISGEDASATNKGVASFAVADFSVSTGAVSIRSGGVSNAQLVNNQITINGTAISLGDSGTLTTQNIGEHSSNLYFTNTRARGAFTGGTGVTYNSGTGEISTTDGDIVHDNLSGFVANEHIDHSTVSIVAGKGLSGGGTIAASRTIDIDSANVRGMFSGGTGVTYTSGSGAIAIGQAVASTDSVDFAGLTVSGNALIAGNLTVTGTQTVVNSNTLNIGDNIITLNADETGTPSQNAGIEVERGTGTNVVLRWNETTDKWQFTNDGSSYEDIGAGITVQEEGSALATAATTLNFVGSAVTATGSGATKTITITGGDLVTDTTPQLGGALDLNANNITGNGNIIIGGHIDIGDANKLKLGASDDLEIYHDGSHSYINETGTGNLILKSSEVQIQSAGGEDMAKFEPDGPVRLYYDNVERFTTTSSGVNIPGSISITGTSTVTGLSSLSGAQFDGNVTPTSGQGVEIFAPDTSTGQIQSFDRTNSNFDKLIIKGDPVEIYDGSTKRIETTNAGATVTGTLTATAFSGDGSALTGISAGNTVSNGSNDRILTSTGGNGIQAEADFQFDGTNLFIPNEIRHIGDPDTKLGFTTDTITLTAGGTAVQTITSSGATINQVIAGGASSKVTLAENTGITVDDGAIDLYQATSNANAVPFKIQSDVGSTKNEFFRITAGGKVGIGTTSPSTALDVNGTVTATSFSGSGASLTGISADLVNDTTPQLGGNLASNGHNIQIADGDIIQIGTGNDLEIYHQSNVSYLKSTNAAAPIRLQAPGGEIMGDFIPDAGVELYHNGTKKFETTSAGATVAGTVTATTLAGTLSTAAQANITSLGVLTALAVTGATNLETVQAETLAIENPASHHTHTVTVATKTSVHPYTGQGSSSAYFLDGKEAPSIILAPNMTYRFDQSDNTNSGHPLRFYLEAAKTTAYTTNVTTNGTPGSAGAYTQIVVTDVTPSVIYYQCSAHAYMGSVASSLTKGTTDHLTEGSTNLYYTDARVNAHLNTSGASSSQVLSWNGSDYAWVAQSGGGGVDSAGINTLADARIAASNISALANVSSTAPSSGQVLKWNGSAWAPAADATGGGGSGGIDSATATTLARAGISVTTATASGGGTLAYNNSTGVLTFAPSTNSGGGGGGGGPSLSSFEYSATQGQTTFAGNDLDGASLSFDANQTAVFLNGVLLKHTNDYIESAGQNRITLNSGADSNDILTVQVFGGGGGVDSAATITLINNTIPGTVDSAYVQARQDTSSNSLDVSSNTIKQFEYTADSAQTTFTGNDANGEALTFSGNDIIVHVNGVMIKETVDYVESASNNRITLTSSADSADLVTITKFTGGAIPHKSGGLFYSFVATAGQTAFSGADASGTQMSFIANQIQVHLNGIMLKETDDYTVNGTTGITLTQGAAVNDILQVSSFATIGGGVQKTENTATAGQTVFAGRHDAQNALVFVNGVLMADSDFTANGGGQISLTDSASAGDIVQVVNIQGLANTDTGINWQGVKTSAFTLKAGEGCFVNSTSAAVTITLPASPNSGNEVRIIDAYGTSATNNITVGRNGSKIEAAAADLTIDVNRAAVGLVYVDNTQGWVLTEK